MEERMNLVLKEFNGICIRRWKESDAFDYAELVNDPDVMRYIGNGKTRDATTAASEISKFQNEIDGQGWSRFAVSIGAEGPLLGYTGFARKDYGIDFGMRFLRSYWGHPSTYISSCLALEYGFTEVGFPSICAITRNNHFRCVSYLKKLFSIEPADGEIDSTAYKMFHITHEHYINTQMENNRKSMHKQPSIQKERDERETYSPYFPKPPTIFPNPAHI